MGSKDWHHKNKAKKAKSLARRKACRESYDRVLVVCEGEKTEPLYFQELADVYRLNSANVCVTGDCGSSPKRVVEYAQDLYKQSCKENNTFDRVFCVFDKDTHPSYHQALDMIAAIMPKNVFAAIASVPCFEYWLLLHFTYTNQAFFATGRYSIAGAVEHALKKYWPDYEKSTSGSFSYCQSSLDFAIKNAKRALKSAEACGNDNPSTRVHELVTYLQNLKRR